MNLYLPRFLLEEKAKLVIKGVFGNGQESKLKLGDEYTAIQKKVNEIYATGVFN